MALHPVPITKESPFMGEACALCKEPFAPGHDIIVCPDDATRHHTHCWEANGNRCTAYGCNGHGPIVDVEEPVRQRRPNRPDPTRSREPFVIGRSEQGETRYVGPERRSKVRVMPTSSFSCAQSCLILSIAFAILLIAFSCFGLWAIADFILNWLEIPYRDPLSLLPFLSTLI